MDISTKTIIQLGDLEKFLEIDDNPIIFTQNNRNPFLNGIWLKKEKKQYFKFVTNYTDLLNDLLGVKITESFQLPSVHYKLAEGYYQGEKLYGLLCQSQETKENPYQTLEELIFNYDFLIQDDFSIKNLSVIRMFDKEYSNYVLPKQLKTLIVRDFVTNEQNRKMSDIKINKTAEVIAISELANFENEWSLSIIKEREDCDDLDINQEEIQLYYQIPGLLTLSEKEANYIRKDDIFQENLAHFLKMDVNGLLEQVELETHLPIIQKDYDYYSLYQETVKQKLKKQGFLS